MTEHDEPVLRPFSDVLRDIGGGQVADEAAAALADVVRAVTATGRKGTLTLKIDITRMAGTDENLVVAARVTPKPPEGEPVASVFFATDAGSLVRDNPDQGTLFTRPVAVPDARINDWKENA